MIKTMRKVVNFYVEGFKGMTWGRTLWIIIAVKLFVMFAVLKLFFFQPTLKGTTEEKQDHVANELTLPQNLPSETSKSGAEKVIP